MDSVNTAGLNEWVDGTQPLQVYVFMASLCLSYKGKEMATPTKEE